MRDDDNCYPNLWKGPYFGSVDADPWGNAYIVNAKNFGVASAPANIVSAGPNGTVETLPDAVQAVGDDIMLRLK